MGVRGEQGTLITVGCGDALDESIRKAKDPCIVLVETPANPTLIMTDLRRAAEAARRHPARPVVMVDNTFLGPVFQHPLALGADLCLYSATKYFSAFSDIIAGAAIAKDPLLIPNILIRLTRLGNNLQPYAFCMLDQR